MDAAAAKERRWPVVAGAFVAGALLLGVVQIVAGAFSDDDEIGSPPGEYLYLDTDRVNAYLGQVQGGLSESEERSETRKRRAEGSATASGITLGGGREEENFVKRVVTPTAADRLYDLRKRLHENEKVTRLDARADLDGRIASLREGQFVEISNSRLRIPPYAALLPKANYAAQLVPKGHRKVEPRFLAPLVQRERAELQGYFDLVAPPIKRRPGQPASAARSDFRLPFVVEDSDRSARVFLPLRNSNLALEPGLASGGLKVLGKVVRVLRGKAEYVDVQTLVTFGRALLQAPPFVRSRLGMSASPTRIEEVVRESATVGAPGLVVVPVGVFQ